MPSPSPMMMQYHEIKQKYSDCILFFRLGDFYEMFYEDALLVSRELELTLTGRDCGLSERAPMCGVPHHSCEAYIKRLIDKGYKVAICEQMENPALAKGVVKRDVIRIITPGTVTEGGFLDEAKNNYIASVYVEKGFFGVSFADISTGEVFLTEMEGKDLEARLINELSKFSPSEVLYNDSFVKLSSVAAFLKNKLRCLAERMEDARYEQQAAEKRIKEYFPATVVESLNLDEHPMAQKSLGALLYYLDYTQRQGAKRIVTASFYNDEQYLALDLTARRNLELLETMRNKEKRGSLLGVLDRTKTAMGKRLMRKFIEQPLVNVAQIVRRQNAVTELVGAPAARDELGEALSNVYDLERLMTKVIYGSVNPRELKALSYTASHLPAVKKVTAGFSGPLLGELHDCIDLMEDIRDLIDRAIGDDPPVVLKDGGFIKDGFNKELDELRDLYKNAKGYIAGIEQSEREKTGIKNLKIGYNRVFGYYIEVSKGNVSLVPDTYIRKQTLTNCERYITEELKSLESRVLTASEKMIVLEQDIFDEVRRFVAGRLGAVQETAYAVAQLDVLCSFAQVAVDNQYVCPEISVDGEIEIIDGRHPVVEQMLGGAPFVPNDTKLDEKDNRVAVITGPNMAGKSTYMRQVAIITIMAQMGCYVPAKSAKIGVVDKIFTRVGASDDLASGQSTFMVEMSEVANILKNATSHSLIILDEIGRGTSTFDGMSIARAVVEYIVKTKKISAKTLFATHYHELSILEKELPGVKNYNIVAKKRGDDIIFLRKIVRGGADDSYGIEVAKLAGVPAPVVNRAKEVLAELEAGKHQGTAVPVLQEEPEAQVSFGQQTESKLLEKLSSIDLNTLTPIEALNVLYELKKMI